MVLAVKTIVGFWQKKQKDLIHLNKYFKEGFDKTYNEVTRKYLYKKQVFIRFFKKKRIIIKGLKNPRIWKIRRSRYNKNIKKKLYYTGSVYYTNSLYTFINEQYKLKFKKIYLLKN